MSNTNHDEVKIKAPQHTKRSKDARSSLLDKTSQIKLITEACNKAAHQETVKVFNQHFKKTDSKMCKHILAPDTYPPPHLPSIDELMFSSNVQTLDLYREYTAVMTPGDKALAVAFSPIPSFDYNVMNLAPDGTFPIGQNNSPWAKNKYETGLSSTYTWFRLLGYKVEAIVTSNALNKGGSHAFYPIRPKTSLNNLQEDNVQLDVTLSKHSPLIERSKVQDDVCGIWVGTDHRAYDWAPIDAWNVTAIHSSSDQLLMDTNLYDSVSGTVHIPLPTYVYHLSAPDSAVQSVLFRVHQFIEVVTIKGSIPIAISEYNAKMEDIIKSKKLGDIPLLEAPALLKSRPSTNKSKDAQWYDKLSYALTGKPMSGTVKDIAKMVGKALPELALLLL